MADVFVSYSRRDSEFVSRLAESISAGGKEVWLDTEGIADAEVFPEAIKRAIEGSDAFLFVITPASVASSYCENEVEHAGEMQKRIVLHGHPLGVDGVAYSPSGALLASARPRRHGQGLGSIDRPAPTRVARPATGDGHRLQLRRQPHRDRRRARHHPHLGRVHGVHQPSRAIEHRARQGHQAADDARATRPS